MGRVAPDGRCGLTSSVQLVGRDQDLAAIRAFIDQAAAEGGALVMSGEAGVGKTAMIEAAITYARTAGLRVLRATGAQFAPDMNIKVHPLRLAKDNLTAVMGVLRGTFSKPMPDGQGGTIAPTGKAFAVDMVPVGIWNRQGTMDEEFLFWDNRTFYGEMGVT
jgi:hypothetical protein